MGITTAGFYRTIVFTSTLYTCTSSHLLKKKNETRYKNILSEKVSGI